MKQTVILIPASFLVLFPYACKNCEQGIEVKNDTKFEIMKDTTPKITGIGGIFFKSKDPEAITEWYKTNLGMVSDEYGAVFESRNTNNPDEINYLRWSAFPDSTDYFAPSEKPFMVNYRVQNIESLVQKLKANGVTVHDEITEYEYGKFVHISDPEGNKIELWEPVDSVLTETESPTTK